MTAATSTSSRALRTALASLLVPSAIVVPITARADGPWLLTWIVCTVVSVPVWAHLIFKPEQAVWRASQPGTRDAVVFLGLLAAAPLLVFSIFLALLWGSSNPVCDEVGGEPPSCLPGAEVTGWLLVLPAVLVAAWVLRQQRHGSPHELGTALRRTGAVVVTACVQVALQFLMLGHA